MLEIECGTGNCMAALDEIIGCLYLSIDPSEEMLAVAKSRNTNAHFAKGAVEQLPNKDGKICPITDFENIIRHHQHLSVYFPETVEIDL